MNILSDESVERLIHIIWFNLSRKKNMTELNEIFKEVLDKLKRRHKLNMDKTKEYLEIILCIITYTRDIRYGKGERDLTYNMIYTLYTFFPIPAVYLIKEIVKTYGSWKDIPRLCNHIKNETSNENPLIITLVEMAINQLKKDQKENDPLSNISKWIPKEKSKYGWLFDVFVKNYYEIASDITNAHRANFRKLVSKMNRKLETRDIKYRRQNANQYNLPRPIQIAQLIKEAKRASSDEQNELDTKWEKYARQWSKMNKHVIPLVDVSAEMTEQEYNTAIGIGLLLSQNSILQNRMILFSQTASWISLQNNIGFTESIKEILKAAPPPTNRKINAGIDLIKSAILETNMSKDQIDNLEIVIISNFNNDACHDHQYMIDYGFNNKITEKKLKTIPNLTYWNVSQNMVIPNKPQDIKYIGGQVFLDEFVGGKDQTKNIKKVLSNPRYDEIRTMFKNLTQ